jgi:transcription elongation factor Elf1
MTIFMKRERFMEKTSHCPKCGKRTVSVNASNGRTELKCIRCDPVDPMQTDFAKWADSPLANPMT